MALTEAGRFRLPYRGSTLVVARGSIVDFSGDAIVNAANTGCVGGGGVDGAIMAAGGRNLLRDRVALEVVGIDREGTEIRCHEGAAVLTGPNRYGTLPPYIIHAVGPNFSYCSPDNIEKGVELLMRAYRQALNIANKHRLEKVGFSLLCAGVFRGPLGLTDVLSIAVEAICRWSQDMRKRHEERGIGVMYVKEIHLCAFTGKECQILLDVCNSLSS